MPVYNAENFLDIAIQSILSQSYKNFEFIIINDGSDDSSLKIINKYVSKDQRIKLVDRKHDGYTSALNEGIRLAKGTYFARMDADDISLPTRFECQVQYLDSHQECVAVFTKIQLIDEANDKLGPWEIDESTITSSQIRKIMPAENCLAHPTLMARTSVMRSFRYDVAQTPSEDYDLWLRLISANKQINKLDKVLLQYRMHAQSVTQMSIMETSSDNKYLAVKRRFLHKQFRKGCLGPTELKVLQSYIQLRFSTVTNKLWDELYQRFNRIRFRVNNRLAKLKNNHRTNASEPLKKVLFIIPWMTVGGADKIIIEIIKGLVTEGCQVFCAVTNRSKNDWQKYFLAYCSDIVDLSEIPSFGDIAEHLARYVTDNGIGTVLISNTVPGYVAIEPIRRDNPNIKIYDIIHGQGGKGEKGGMPYHSAQFDKFIDKRIVVTEYMKRYLMKNYSVNPKKIVVIHNGIRQDNKAQPPPAPEIKKLRKAGKDFIVLWSGRFNPEKHPELVIEIARKIAGKSDSFGFVLTGNGEEKSKLKKLIIEYGLKHTVLITKTAYTNPGPYMAHSDLLLMTSEMEGLPLVILEAFSYALPVVAPKVGGIPEIIRNGRNGYLINYSSRFADTAASKIVSLGSDKALSKKMGGQGYNLIKENFSVDQMISKYSKTIGLK